MDYQSLENDDEVAKKKNLFMDNIDSKLHIDMDEMQIIENTEWIEQVEFTIPYIYKAFSKANKYMVTEEEILKMELIKKVSVDSIKHLSKHTDMVTKFEEDTGEVVPERLLNSNKEESYMTYENRFLYTLVELIKDFIYIREKSKKDNVNKGKSGQKATYEGVTKIRGQKINIKFEYDVKKVEEKENDADLEKKVTKIYDGLREISQTEIYKTLSSTKVIPVKSPLKMTNVFLKNVNYQYAVKLWNYLNDNFDLKNTSKHIQVSKDVSGQAKQMIDENFFSKYLIFNNIAEQYKNKAKVKSQNKFALTKEEKEKITDSLVEQIFELNPEFSENELSKTIGDKYVIYKSKMEASTKPIKEKFKEEINKYMSKVEKLRLK